MNMSQSQAIAARRGVLGTNGWLAMLLLLPFAWGTTTQGNAFPLYLFKSQDLPVVGGLMLLLLVTDRWSPRWTLPVARPSYGAVAAAGACLALLLWWGCYALLGNYPLSRDEHMVVFDMAVFSHGHLAEPLAPQWRSFASDLVPAFLLNEHEPQGLVSSYLPGNAALRLVFSKIADPALMNPLFVLCGGLALLNIAKRIYSEDNRAIWAALLIYALSAQVAANAMTTYAMTAHMALNLLWLAAFLRGRWWSHALCIGIGFVATGLHQLVFHPLFAAPFLLWRLREGQWRLVLVYGAAYGAVLAWWIVYPMLASLQAGMAPVGSQAHFFADRVWPLLVQRDPLTIPEMVLNLLRFIAWQNLALLPLLAAAAPLVLQSRSIAAPMAWGIAGATLFFALILPYQGHGWGYRYLHPFLGSFALLGGMGYQRLAAAKGRAADGMVLLLSLVTLAASEPYLLDRMRAFFAPHLALERLIARQQGDFILIDTEDERDFTDGAWGANAIDAVRNSPDLTNRPLRFSSRALPQRSLSELCRRGTVALITRADMRRVGFALNSPPLSPRFDAMVMKAHQDFPRCLHAAH